MKLRHVGFFSELLHGEPFGGSLKASVSDTPQENERKIVEYLRSGTVFVAAPGLTKDVLNKDQTIIGALSILTDGTWCWPSDLPHYVEKYHARVSADVLRTMAENDWMVPNGIDLQLLEL